MRLVLVISALRKLRHHYDFEAIQGYTVSSRQAWAIERDSELKTKQNKKPNEPPILRSVNQQTKKQNKTKD